MPELVAKRPIDVPTHETLMFLTSNISVGAEVLEIGCGEGYVASELLRRGYQVTGLDSDPEVVVRAQKRGVPAIVGSWPEFSGSVSFDAIAFTRSLHHINPLGEAISRARELLRPGGLLLVEDFAFGEVDETTIHWFAKLLRSKHARALINPIAGQFVTELLSSTDVLDVWERNRGHDLHPIATMNEAITEHFVLEATRSVPYLYRYLIPVLAETAKTTSFVEEVLKEETLLGQRGEIVLLGRRIVASP